MKRVVRLVGLAGLLILVLATIGFLTWTLWIPTPGQTALKAIATDDSVTVTKDPFLTFTPKISKSKVALVFYPGARVDVGAYSPLARMIAEKGYLVVVPSMPLNMALFAPNRAKKVIDDFPEIRTWIIGGHSMGGAFAAQFAHDNQEIISGLVLVGSYLPPNVDLSRSSIKAASIYGSADDIATPNEVLAAKPYMPPATEWVKVIGGNHSQFGDYGKQYGDSEAYIPADDQHQITAAAIIGLLERISPGSL